jgi:hypothetical protein
MAIFLFKNKYRPATLSLVILVLLLGYQNCGDLSNRLAFSGGSGSKKTGYSTNANGGNGDGYLGKPEGDFVRTYPDYSCPDQPALALGITFQSFLNIANSELVLRSDNCRDLSYRLDLADVQVEFSRYNLDFVGVNAAIMERAEYLTLPHVTESWCRWSTSTEGFDSIIRLRQQDASAQVYVGSDLDKPTFQAARTPEFLVTRLESANQYHYSAKDFSLTIMKLANTLGRHNGQLQVTIDGTTVDKSVSCRMANLERAVPLTDAGLVGLWQFNGPLAAASSASPLIDQSSNGLTATPVDADNTQVFSPGRFKESLNFDGVDDQVRVPATSSFANLQTLTVVAWLKAAYWPTSGGGIANTGDMSPLTSGWRFFIPGGTNRLGFYAAFSGTPLWAGTGSNAVLNGWTQVAVTWDGSANTSGVQFYSNGAPIPMGYPVTEGAGTRVVEALNPLTFGGYGDDGGILYRGEMDNVQVFNRILSPAEINNLYINGAL